MYEIIFTFSYSGIFISHSSYCFVQSEQHALMIPHKLSRNHGTELSSARHPNSEWRLKVTIDLTKIVDNCKFRRGTAYQWWDLFPNFCQEHCLITRIFLLFFRACFYGTKVNRSSVSDSYLVQEKTWQPTFDIKSDCKQYRYNMAKLNKLFKRSNKRVCVHISTEAWLF